MVDAGPNEDVTEAAPLERGAHVGRYEILESVGAGGMGRVYAAYDPALDRKIALKLLHPTAATVDLRARLMREAKAMARLSQPEVITVHDVGQHGDQLFIAMEFVEGGTLRQWLAKGPRSVDEIVAAFVQAARGLAASHDVGMVHRDFKPDNVLVRPDGRVLVSDFGLVRDVENVSGVGQARPDHHVLVPDGIVPTSVNALSPTIVASSSSESGVSATSTIRSDSELTAAGTILGTPAYMAPEQITREGASARSDVFSFSVSLYEALYGARPFRGSTVAATFAAMKEGLRFPRRAPPVPERLRAALRAGLQYDPAKRPATMREMLLLLQPSPARARGSFGTFVAVAIVGAAGGFGFVWARRPPPPIAVAGATAPPPPLPPLVIDQKSFRRVTFDEGCEEFPSFAPDGQSIAYDGQIDDRSVILVLSLADRKRRQLTRPNHATDIAPAISPRGDMVAFDRLDGEARGTYVVDFAGNDPPRLVCEGSTHPSWSRDGTAVFCGPRERIEKRSVRDGSLLMTFPSPAGAGASESAELPGGELAVNFPQIGEVTLEGLGVFGKDGAFRWLTHESDNQVLAIAPGDKHVLGVRRLTSGEEELVAAPVDGSSVISLVKSSVEPHKGLTISRDGRTLAYSECDGGAAIADLDAHGALQNVSHKAEWQDEDIAGLAGTDRLLVATTRGGGGDFEAWVVDRSDPAQSRKLDAGGRYVYYVTASPDGLVGALVTRGEGIFLAPIDGSSPARQLTTGARDLHPAFLGPDLLFTRVDDAGKGRILRVPLTGGEPRPMFDFGTSEAATSPDMRWVVYLASKGGAAEEPEIYDVHSGRSAPLSSELGTGTYSSPRFSPDGRKVALVKARHQIVEVDLATRRTKLLTESGDLLLRLTYARRGIVVARVQWTGDISMADIVAPTPHP
jgi:Tol biopolymer transport system component